MVRRDDLVEMWDLRNETDQFSSQNLKANNLTRPLKLKRFRISVHWSSTERISETLQHTILISGMS